MIFHISYAERIGCIYYNKPVQLEPRNLSYSIVGERHNFTLTKSGRLKTLSKLDNPVYRLTISTSNGNTKQIDVVNNRSLCIRDKKDIVEKKTYNISDVIINLPKKGTALSAKNKSKYLE
jgi:hypothetical protein